MGDPGGSFAVLSDAEAKDVSTSRRIGNIFVEDANERNIDKEDDDRKMSAEAE